MIVKFETVIKILVTFIISAVIIMAAYIKFVNPNKNNINNDNIALQDAILPDITGANAEYDDYDVIRGYIEYKVISAEITKNVTEKELGEFKKAELIDGHIDNGYSAVIITIDITNVKDVVKDIYINNNVIDIYDSNMNIFRLGYEINYMTRTLDGGKALYKIELKPGETIREVCYYYIEDEYLSEDYIAEYVINPQGVSDDVVTNTGNNIFDYIVRYKISDLIKNTN